ncbi:hypothetical protein [Galbibacter pacificus]|uniref:DUF2306 domain-containing protein n=1 Tax=Galbibacter pacificus TaxID=2996052 RepID=A0ABT6FU24_9FLAO|nr:hypothetical protein [Galbibacter pacificus]MDG3583287.1 hypothetical protein [Galbibacter pacificus]MDG3586768.1 hypothetical protein [Galbibacter pacificus]
MGLSNLGIFHTFIGIIAIIVAVISYARFGKVNLTHITGKIYFYTTIVTSLTALGIFNHGGFNPGHIFALFIVVLVLAGYYLHAKKTGNNRFRYIENFLLSFSFFLSWVPTVNETLNRIPVGRPLANGPTDPLIGKTLLVLFVLFIIGSVHQFRQQRKLNKKGHQ